MYLVISGLSFYQGKEMIKDFTKLELGIILRGRDP